MIVRLKGIARRFYSFFSKRFNSMIVRLKVYETNVMRVLKFMFQFYDSPIKSIFYKIPSKHLS